MPTRRHLAALATVTLVLTACSPEETTPPSQPASEVTLAVPPAATEAPSEGDGVTVTVLLDGWSAVALGRLRLSWQDDVGRDAEPLEFAPLAGESLRELVAEIPDIGTRTAARLFTPDASVQCDTSVCSASGTEFDLADLTTSTVADVLTSWDVTSALHVATFTTASGATQVAIEGPAGTTLATLTTVEGEGPDGDLSDESLESVAGGSLGYGRSTLLLGYAFGTPFYIDPLWTNPDVQPGLPATTQPRVFSYDGDAPELDVAALVGGLGDPNDEFAAMSDTQLTFFSSPTSGCGFAFVCTPTAVAADVELGNTTTAIVCDTTRSPGMAGFEVQAAQTAGREIDALTLALTTQDVLVTVDPDGRAVHQAGVWGGQQVDNFLAAGSATPPTQQTPYTVRIAAATTWASSTSGGPPKVFEVFGYAQQPGQDDTSSVWDVDAVAALSDGRVSSC